MKSDVYAFGVVLFELLCGRVALDNSLDEDKCSLVKWAPECIKKGKVHNIIDLKIKSQISEKCLKKFVAIAYRCLNSESQRRPNMTEILAALELCRELQNNSDRVKSAAGTSSIIRMFKWPFMSPEVTSENSGGEIDDLKLPDFKVYTYNQLRAATEWFSENNLLYKGGDKVPSAVYKGKLEDDGRLIVDEAKAVGRFRSKRLANLLGCCIEGDERYLVAEFMPHGSLSKHLFHRESQPLNWAMRLRVALYLAQSLDYCSSKGRFLYHDLTAKRVLFDQECNPRLSSFGLMKDKRDKKNNERDLNFRPPEYNTEGVTTEGALGLIQAENFQMLIDSYLNGHISNDDRTELVRIASHCLQYSPEERPNAKSVVAALTNLQKQTDASSLALFGISNEPIPATNISKLSPLAHACERMDLFAIHAILEKIGYSGDAGLTFDFFDQMANDLIEGNKAFKASYFYEAIGWYTNLIEDGGAMLVSPTIYVRRCLCYLITYQKDKALGDAKQAQCGDGCTITLYKCPKLDPARSPISQFFVPNRTNHTTASSPSG
ncbi:hypothetical protein L1987_50903 [Smallanthus sonchifolius]|uniref:Uncharacterized protein n=1 Tax=Smallanthus sonchifolius TaxID=185202 RepID=A0ACB9EN69_9ASTR|nr:hypothetical protein L1987_50903 [Smallanthus sonchifolius]